MIYMKRFFSALFILAAAFGCNAQNKKGKVQVKAPEKNYTVTKTDAEWRKQLTPLQFDVTRRKGTERPYTGNTWDNHKEGIYQCIACDQPLFNSSAKFESGTGWPSFFQPMSPKYLEELTDKSHGMSRTEVNCSRCGSHLGHVFDDGPKPTGLRYCMNSASMKFIAKK
jgi:peptide-methionine (R)-S-oxide reductase